MEVAADVAVFAGKPVGSLIVNVALVAGVGVNGCTNVYCLGADGECDLSRGSSRLLLVG